MIDPFLFGEPRKGLRKIRIPILDWALLDTALTAFVAYYISKHVILTDNFWIVFGLLLLIGKASHRLVRLDTPLN